LGSPEDTVGVELHCRLWYYIVLCQYVLYVYFTGLYLVGVGPVLVSQLKVLLHYVIYLVVNPFLVGGCIGPDLALLIW